MYEQGSEFWQVFLSEIAHTTYSVDDPVVFFPKHISQEEGLVLFQPHLLSAGQSLTLPQIWFFLTIAKY